MTETWREYELQLTFVGDSQPRLFRISESSDQQAHRTLQSIFTSSTGSALIEDSSGRMWRINSATVTSGTVTPID